MNAITMMVNAARRLESMFPGYFPETKHNHYRDFGYPEHVTFDLAYSMYRRNGIAHAAIKKTADKTWQDYPWLLEKERSDKESETETEIRKKFDDLRFWQRMADADRRAMVGGYSGLILRIADNKRFKDPVDTVTSGLDALVEIIPAWAGQLDVSQWDTNEQSETYGQPLMYSFNEASVGNDRNKSRAFELHPDRVIIWSDDGTVHARSMLEPGFNDLLTLEKISGAGGEGFWKNAKSAPVLEADKETDIGKMASAMGVQPAEVADKMSEQVEDFQKGFDQLLFLQGIKASTLPVNLPSPEHFYSIALQAFAASVSMPVKIMVGMQTGERASTEDAKEWAQTCMSRRTNYVRPLIMETINRLERFNMLPERDWYLDWSDLTESSIDEKIARADKMADVNVKLKDSGEWGFTPEEIRGAADYEPLEESQKYRDQMTDQEREAASGI